MSGDFEKRLDFDSDIFKEMKRDMNFILQSLIGNMREKDTNEGSMTLKIDITIVKEFIPNYDPDIKGELREISKPQFKHKVTSTVKINEEKSGSFNSAMELVMDEDVGIFKLVPIINTAQRSIFDDDFEDVSPANTEHVDGEIVNLEGYETGEERSESPQMGGTYQGEYSYAEGGEDAPLGGNDILFGASESGFIDDEFSYEEPEED